MSKDLLGPIALSALLAVLGFFGAVMVDSVRDLETRVAANERTLALLLKDRIRGGGR